MHKEEDVISIISMATEINRNDLVPELDLVKHNKMGKIKFLYMIYALESKFGIIFPYDPFLCNTPQKILHFLNSKKNGVN